MQIDSTEGPASWATKLISCVREVNPTLVIVDPLRMFWPQAEGKNEDTVDMVRRLKSLSSETGCSWLITHHRRKVNQAGAVQIEDNVHGWFQEAAGAHALVNQSDTRIGLEPHSGRVDLLLAGFMRGMGPFVPLDLARETDNQGSPVGYRLLTGIEHLSSNDRAVFDALRGRFRFRDVLTSMGGTSGSNANRFVSKCQSLGIVHKEGAEYVKAGPTVE
jgi:hypothetical protein